MPVLLHHEIILAQIVNQFSVLVPHAGQNVHHVDVDGNRRGFGKRRTLSGRSSLSTWRSLSGSLRIRRGLRTRRLGVCGGGPFAGKFPNSNTAIRAATHGLDQIFTPRCIKPSLEIIRT